MILANLALYKVDKVVQKNFFFFFVEIELEAITIPPSHSVDIVSVGRCRQETLSIRPFAYGITRQ